MSKKFFIALSISGLLILGGISVVHFLPTEIYYKLKHKILRDKMITYVNEKYGVIVEFPSTFIVKRVNNASFSVLHGGDTQPYVITFETTPHLSFQSWYQSQTWPGTRQDYFMATSTRGESMIVSDFTQTLYTMLRPRVLLTIQNAVSSERHYQSQKILMEMVDDMKLLPQ